MVRNKIRRRIKEILRKADIRGYDITIITTKDILDKSYQDIKKIIYARLPI